MKLKLFNDNPNEAQLKKRIKYSIERIMGIPHLTSILEQYRLHLTGSFPENFGRFYNWKFKTTNISQIEEYMKFKGMIIFCNHPHGLADLGVIGKVTQTLLKRDDLMIVSNKVIANVFPELGKISILVDNMGKKGEARNRNNTLAYKKMVDHVKQGGMLCIFPSGETSHFKLTSPEGRLKITDALWKKSLYRLAVDTKAPLMPIYIKGHTSFLYLLLRTININLARLYNFRVFIKSKNKSFTYSIKAPIHEQVASKLSRDEFLIRARDVLYRP